MRNGTVLEAPQDGQVINDPAVAQMAEQQGWQKCATMSGRRGAAPAGPCNFWINPSGQTAIGEHRGYYTCPNCSSSYNMVHSIPSLATSPEEAQHNYEQHLQDPYHTFTTHAGIAPGDMGQIAEDVVQGLHAIPGYGPIVWWHPGGALANSALDGATADWGLEVKGISKDAKNHGFFPSGDKVNVAKKLPSAVAMGKRGVLGILVILNFRANVADVFAKEFPAEGGRVGEFRTNRPNVQHLVAEVPFKNPFMDPNDPSPVRGGPVSPSAPSSSLGDAPSSFSSPEPDLPF